MYKRQVYGANGVDYTLENTGAITGYVTQLQARGKGVYISVSYTHLRAHETVLDLVCRLLLEKKNNHFINNITNLTTQRPLYTTKPNPH